MWTFLLWNIAALATGIYCSAKAVIDFRARKDAWGVIGLLSGIFLFVRPIQAHVAKVDPHG